MRSRWTYRSLFGLLTIIAFSGCNPLTMMYFLFGAPEKKLPAEFPLTAEKKKETKLLVLFSAPVNMDYDFIGADRLLTSEFIQALTLGLKENKEKVTIVPSRKIDKYKEDHPNWRSRNPSEIGEAFEADFVVNFEIEELRMYMPGSRKQFFQGFARVTGTAYDLTKPDSEPKELQEFTLEYPRGTPIAVESNESISKFRQKFLQQIAVELSWKFTAHELRDKVSGGNRLID
jgi:hypothetical protein